MPDDSFALSVDAAFEIFDYAIIISDDDDS